jgi:hypothetical protein
MTAFKPWSRISWRGPGTLCASVISGFLAALAGCAAGGAGGDTTPTPPPDDGDSVNVAREIEEADIIRLEGDILYVANPYTGLRLIDVSDPDDPRFLPAFPLAGRAIELFVRDGHVFILTAADFQYCAGDPVGYDDETWDDVSRPDYEGTRLWVIDVTEPQDMSLRATITFAGSTVGTRRVGDVIYAAGFVGTTGFVQSVNIADAGHVVAVENQRMNVPVDFIHVSANAVYLVGPDDSEEQTSLVTYIDISDPAGSIGIRDAFRVRGEVSNRFFMDEHEGTFRIVTEEFLSSTYSVVVALYNYDVRDPDNIERVSRLLIDADAGLRSVRFDGDLAYVTTSWSEKSLHVLDLQSPQAPVIADQIEAPGIGTSLFPMGDRLLTVGFTGGYSLRPALTLFDVSNPQHVRELSHLTMGEPDNWTVGSSATVDEKAIRVLRSADLILMPMARFDFESGEYTDELQLISMKDSGMERKGLIAHRGLIRRADLLEDRAWTLSDLSFQILDIDNLNKPESVANLDFVTEQDLLDAGLLRCADSARVRGTSVWGGYYGGYGCGAMPIGALPVTAVGLIALRLVHRRRR